MKWVRQGKLEAFECVIASGIKAVVWRRPSQKWTADIMLSSEGCSIWESDNFGAEDEAKAAVCHWIGRTMAQFSNALAAGCNEQDDGA